MNGTGSSGGATFAVDEGSGALVWTKSYGGGGGSAAIADCVVYEAEGCDAFSAFDLSSGTPLWMHQGKCLGGDGQTPAAYRGKLWELDGTSGNTIVNASGTAVGSFAADYLPSFHAGTAFYVSRGVLTAVNLASGVAEWTFDGGGSLCASAVVAGGGGQVFVASDNIVYELDEASGAMKSTATVSGELCGSNTLQPLTLAANRLLVPVGNTLVAY